MKTQLIAYLMFKGEAKEAMDFYKSIFGGKLAADKFSDGPGAEEVSEENKDKIMHAQLEADGFTIMASDMMGDEEFVQGNKVALTFVGDDKAQLTGFFEGLSEGGKVTSPLKEEFWGDTFGVVEDKFGVTWMVNINKPQ